MMSQTAARRGTAGKEPRRRDRFAWPLRYHCLAMEETQTPPQVSVLVVSWNDASSLRRCLASLEQSNERERFEVLVVDNASQDESPRLDAEFPNATFLRLPRHFGLVKALNIGMRTAKGEFYFFLAPAVEVLPDTVMSLAARLAAEDEAAAVCPLLVGPDSGRVPQFFRLPSPETLPAVSRRGSFESDSPDLEGERVQVAFPCLSALMVRSYFLKGLRYIDQRYGQSWADAEIAAQIRRASKRIFLYPGIRAVLHREEEGRFGPAVRALLSADWALGAATFGAKHYGFGTGLKVRAALIAGALGQAVLALVRFRDVGYHFSRFGFVLRGQKLDGTQAIL